MKIVVFSLLVVVALAKTTDWETVGLWARQLQGAVDKRDRDVAITAARKVLGHLGSDSTLHAVGVSSTGDAYGVTVVAAEHVLGTSKTATLSWNARKSGVIVTGLGEKKGPVVLVPCVRETMEMNEPSRWDPSSWGFDHKGVEVLSLDLKLEEETAAWGNPGSYSEFLRQNAAALNVCGDCLYSVPVGKVSKEEAKQQQIPVVMGHLIARNHAGQDYMEFRVDAKVKGSSTNGKSLCTSEMWESFLV